jgi:hypothetical protein
VLASVSLSAPVVYGGGFGPSYAWPAGGAGGFHLSSNGLLLGNINTGKYFAVDADGQIGIGSGGGARMVTSNNAIKVFDASNQLRVQIGNLNA